MLRIDPKQMLSQWAMGIRKEMNTSLFQQDFWLRWVMRGQGWLDHFSYPRQQSTLLPTLKKLLPSLLTPPRWREGAAHCPHPSPALWSGKTCSQSTEVIWPPHSSHTQIIGHCPPSLSPPDTRTRQEATHPSQPLVWWRQWGKREE